MESVFVHLEPSCAMVFLVTVAIVVPVSVALTLLFCYFVKRKKKPSEFAYSMTPNEIRHGIVSDVWFK